MAGKAEFLAVDSLGDGKAKVGIIRKARLTVRRHGIVDDGFYSCVGKLVLKIITVFGKDGKYVKYRIVPIVEGWKGNEAVGQFVNIALGYRTAT